MTTTPPSLDFAMDQPFSTTPEPARDGLGAGLAITDLPIAPSLPPPVALARSPPTPRHRNSSPSRQHFHSPSITSIPSYPASPGSMGEPAAPYYHHQHHHQSHHPHLGQGAPGLVQQHQPGPPGSASASASGFHNGSAGSSSTYAQQMEAKRNSVVIKVGMVGDAQIGKTSLMVKYVEGSFDEDYIQTLGMCPGLVASSDACARRMLNVAEASTSWRRPYRSATPRSPFQSGTWAASASLSTCCRSCATMPSPSSSCLTSPARAR